VTKRSSISNLERICAESYQVVGWLAYECGLFAPLLTTCTTTSRRDSPVELLEVAVAE